MLLVTGAVLVAAAMLVLWVAWASRRDRLRPNSAIGVRTPETLASDAAWFAAQRAAASATAIGGWGTLAGGLAALVLAAIEALTPDMAFPVAWGAWMLLAIGAAGWSLGWTLIGAGRGARAAHALVRD